MQTARTRGKHRWKAMVGAAVLASGAYVALAGAPAQAQPAPTTDWCTGVADRGEHFDFGPSCRRHDICYGVKPYGDTAGGRYACDWEFATNMRNSCGNRPVSQRRACENEMVTYFTGVRALGGYFFNAAEPPAPNVTVGEPVQVCSTCGGGGGGSSAGNRTGTVIVGPPQQISTTPRGTVTVGTPQQISSSPSATVTVGEPEQIDTSSE